MTVYFAQATNGGPIKVGHTGDMRSRRVMLGTFIPGGVEVLAQIPGGAAREHALHWALSPFRLQGEWFPACAPVWRVIIEAIDAGDLAWLPNPPHDHAATQRLYRETFTTGAAAARALGLCQSGVPMIKGVLTPYTSSTFAGRLALYVSRQTTPLPAYLTPSLASEMAAA